MEPITVAIVDDQQLIRAGLEMLINSQDNLQVVAQASDGQQAVESSEVIAADVILMDIRMPVMNGIEATRHILGAKPSAKIIVLTTFDVDEYVLAALEAGASGFLIKDTPPDQLLAAVHNVVEGDAVIAPTATRRLLNRLITPQNPHNLKPGSAEHRALASLTTREHEVLVEMSAGLSNAEIAVNLFVSETTVKSHVRRILEKLGVRDRIQAVVFAYRNGVVPTSE